MSAFSDAPCVFLDRDGTIIYDKQYLSDPEKVALLPGAAEGLALLQAAGCPLVVLSNQSGIGRGYFDKASVDAVNARLNGLLRARGVYLTGILYCPHAPEAQCLCRKPAPGLALEAARLWHLEEQLRAGLCVSVGDKMSDVRLAQGLGGRGVLVLTGKGEAEVLNSGLPMAHWDALSHYPLLGREQTYAAPKPMSQESSPPDYVAKDLRDAAQWIVDFRKKNAGQKP